jgi:hypothetical protein
MNILRDKWPCSRRAAEQRDERAAPHSITSSAVASSVGGTSRPSIRGVYPARNNPYEFQMTHCLPVTMGHDVVTLDPVAV